MFHCHCRPTLLGQLSESGAEVHRHLSENTGIKKFLHEAKKINNMFLRHFFQEKMREGDFLFFTFLFHILRKNDVLTMFRENFRL